VSATCIHSFHPIPTYHSCFQMHQFLQIEPFFLYWNHNPSSVLRVMDLYLKLESIIDLPIPIYHKKILHFSRDIPPKRIVFFDAESYAIENAYLGSGPISYFWIHRHTSVAIHSCLKP
jgi:hypothetical protein